MSIFDAIKKSVVSEFTGTISVDQMLMSLLVAFVIGLFIVYIYRKTYTGVVYSKAFSLCIIMLAMVTSMIIRTISSNIALSLGLVGALSIVRFRTAVKEPVDTGFMFWGISAGIMAGAGYNINAQEDVVKVLKTIPKYKIRSKSLYGNEVEFTFEVDVKHDKKDDKINDQIVDKFNEVDGMINASLISYQNDFGD